MILLVDFGNDHVLVVALHIGGYTLGNEESGNTLHGFHFFPLVIGIKVNLGTVVQIDVIFHTAMFLIGLDTGDRGIGEMLFDKSGDGFGQ